jgi:hypothetical protein
MKGLMKDDGTGFREDLDSADCSWMKKKGVMFLAAEADRAALPPWGQHGNVQEYLQSIIGKLKSFMKSDKMYNRNKLMAKLKGILSESGEVLLLSGPRYVGKAAFSRTSQRK